jgi:hypothetical protein
MTKDFFLLFLLKIAYDSSNACKKQGWRCGSGDFQPLIDSSYAGWQYHHQAFTDSYEINLMRGWSKGLTNGNPKGL